MLNAVMYLLGAACLFVWRWMNWLKYAAPTISAWSWWVDRKHIAQNVTRLIVTVFALGLWLNGMLTLALDEIIPDGFLTPGQLKVAWYISGPAGFFITWASGGLAKWISAAPAGTDD